MKFLFSLLIVFISSETISDNENLNKYNEECEKNNNNKENCISIKLESSDYQCCYIEGYCSALTLENYLFYSNNILKAMNKEISGFEYSIKNNFESKYNLFQGECQNGKINLSEEDIQYTEDDKKILKSDNHCLYYHYKVLSNELVNSKDTCLNADLLKSSDDLGIECGYYEFTIYSEIIGEKKIKTCYLFNPEIIKYKNIDEGNKYILNRIASDLSGDGKFSSYTFDIHYSNEVSFSYNSKTNELSEISEKDSSDILYIYKYIFLLFLFLI